MILDRFVAGSLADSSEVQFFTRDSRLSFEDAMQLMADYVIPALVPTMLATFPRHRWLGGEISIDWLGLVEAHHGLLRDVLTKLTARLGPVRQDVHSIASTWDGSVQGALAWAEGNDGADGDMVVPALCPNMSQ